MGEQICSFVEKVLSMVVLKVLYGDTYLDKENKTVHLGNSSQLKTKVLYIKEILEKEKEKEGIIFVNGDFTQKFKAYFREKV